MKKYFIFCPLICWSLISTYSQNPETRSLSSFTKIQVSEQIVLVLEQADENKIYLESAPQVWNEDIVTEVTNGVLSVRTKGQWQFDKAVFCHLYCAEELTKLSATEGGIIRTDSTAVLKSKKLEINATIDGFFNLNVDVDELNIKAGQGSDIYIKGHAKKVMIDASAGAKVHMEELDCREAKITAFMGSKVWLTATDSYIAHAGTGAKIYYTQVPTGEFKRSKVTGGNVELITQ